MAEPTTNCVMLLTNLAVKHGVKLTLTEKDRVYTLRHGKAVVVSTASIDELELIVWGILLCKSIIERPATPAGRKG